jgi:flavin-dependent dehydrogenase
MINIVGSGPVGLYLAHLLSKKGFKVNVYEEHKLVGKPISCSGLVTKEITKFKISLSNSVVNKFKEVTINSKNQTLTIKNDDLLLDRYLFDNEIRKMVESEGVKINYGYRFLSNKIENNTKICEFSNKNEIKKLTCDSLIGADGPLSLVAKNNGLWNNRKFYFGLQGEQTKKFKPHNYSVHFNSTFLSDFFWWSIPENSKISRVGLASKFCAKQKYEILKSKFGLKNTIAGLIPIYKPFVRCSDIRKKVFLVGDAGTLLKNTTGGGIISGLTSAQMLCDAICKEKDYDKLLYPLHLKLTMHHLLRKTLDNCTNSDYDKLISYVKQKRIRKIIESENRDNPISMAFGILLKEPRFLRFSTKIL